MGAPGWAVKPWLNQEERLMLLPMNDDGGACA